MLLMNLQTDLIQTFSENCVIPEGNTARTIAMTDTNTKLLQQLNSGFRRTINWNKYQSKISMERPSEYLNYIICFIF